MSNEYQSTIKECWLGDLGLSAPMASWMLNGTPSGQASLWAPKENGERSPFRNKKGRIRPFFWEG